MGPGPIPGLHVCLHACVPACRCTHRPTAWFLPRSPWSSSSRPSQMGDRPRIWQGGRGGLLPPSRSCAVLTNDGEEALAGPSSGARVSGRDRCGASGEVWPRLPGGNLTETSRAASFGRVTCFRPHSRASLTCSQRIFPSLPNSARTLRQTQHRRHRDAARPP